MYEPLMNGPLQVKAQSKTTFHGDSVTLQSYEHA